MPADSSPPPWDDSQALSMVGATVLIGVTIRKENGEVDRQTQMHGTIASATRDQGVVIVLGGRFYGESYTLPPDLRAFRPADPGAYRLKATGEVIQNPRYLTTWTINKSDPTALA